MEIQRRGTIHRRVSLVVMGIDDFTNQIVQDASLQVWIPGQLRPVRKTAGYYVFLDCPREPVSVKLSAPVFYEVEITVDLQQAREEPLIMRVRLHPNGRYPFPRGVFLLEGSAAPGSTIQVLGGSSPSVKLMADYRKEDSGKRLQLFQPDGFCLDGKLFEICTKDDSSAEQFRIVQQSEEEMFCCCLAHPLQKTYKKVQTRIRPVAETNADAEGQYLLPLYCGEGQLLSCQCLTGEKMQHKECLASGDRIRLDFD